MAEAVAAQRVMVEAMRRIGVALTGIARQLEAAGHSEPPELRPLLLDIRLVLASAIAGGTMPPPAITP